MTTTRALIDSYLGSKNLHHAIKIADSLLEETNSRTTKANLDYITSICPTKGYRLDNPMVGLGLGIAGGVILTATGAAPAVVACNGMLGGMVGMFGSAGALVGMNSASYSSTMNTLWSIANWHYRSIAAQEFIDMPRLKESSSERKEEKAAQPSKIEEVLEQYMKTGQIKFAREIKSIILSAKPEEFSHNSRHISNVMDCLVCARESFRLFPLPRSYVLQDGKDESLIGKLTPEKSRVLEGLRDIAKARLTIGNDKRDLATFMEKDNVKPEAESHEYMAATPSIGLHKRR